MKRRIQNRLTSGLRKDTSPRPASPAQSTSSSQQKRARTESQGTTGVVIPRTDSPIPDTGSRDDLRDTVQAAVPLVQSRSASSQSGRQIIPVKPDVPSPLKFPEQAHIAAPTSSSSVPRIPPPPPPTALPLVAPANTADTSIPSPAIPREILINLTQADIHHPIPLSRSSTFDNDRPISEQYRFLDSSTWNVGSNNNESASKDGERRGVSDDGEKSREGETTVATSNVPAFARLQEEEFKPSVPSSVSIIGSGSVSAPSASRGDRGTSSEPYDPSLNRKPSHMSISTTNPFENSRFEIQEIQPIPIHRSPTDSIYITHHDTDSHPSLLDTQPPVPLMPMGINPGMPIPVPIKRSNSELTENSFDFTSLPQAYTQGVDLHSTSHQMPIPVDVQISPMPPVPPLHEVIPRRVPFIFFPPSHQDIHNIFEILSPPSPPDTPDTPTHVDTEIELQPLDVGSNRSMVRSESEADLKMPKARPVPGLASEVVRHDDVENERSERQPLLTKRLARVDTGDMETLVNSVWPSRTPSQNVNPASLGWTEYVLPDSSYYYYHPLTRVVTNIDLRDTGKLNAVTSYLDHSQEISLIDHNNSRSSAVPDWDCWLRDTAPLRGSFEPWTVWISHSARTVGSEGPSRSQPELSDVERLKTEAEYWAYIQSHPAHVDLSSDAYSEALESLTWNYTDRLFVSSTPQHVPPPFTAHECQESLQLLRHLETVRMPAPGIIRIIAKILQRTAEWRYKLAIPDKTHPTTKSLAIRPFKSTFRHFIMAIVCLGIPYLHFNEEESLQTLSRDKTVIYSPNFRPYLSGGCCLVAALLLSTSVTFLAVPGLDTAARIAVLVSVLCSAGSLISSYVLLMKSNPSTSGGIGGNIDDESLVRIGGIRASIPAVLLAYSTCSLISAVILYAFRGQHVSPGSDDNGFGALTKWVVVGTWVALFAILAGTFGVSRKFFS